MRLHQEKKHWILKAIVGVVVIFLLTVMFKDFTPAQTTVEKTITYGQK